MSEYAPSGGLIDPIDAELFRRPQHTLPNFPEPGYRRPGGEAAALTTDELVQEIALESKLILDAARAEGMPDPCLTIIAGNMLGGTTEGLLDAARKRKATGETPAWSGDAMSYTWKLLDSAGKRGIKVHLHLPPEVAEHQATRSAIERAGLNPDEVIVSEPMLNDNFLDKLGVLAEQRDKITRWQEAWTPVIPTVPISDDYKASPEHSSATLKTTAASAEQALHLVTEKNQDLVRHQEWASLIPGILLPQIGEDTESFDEIVRRELQDVDAAMNRLLAERDEKISAIVARENQSEETDAVITILPAHTKNGDEQIRAAMTAAEKDIDGLGAGTIWDQITPNATLRTLRYVEHRFLRRKVKKENLHLLGAGALVGRQFDKLAEPGTVVDRKEDIWAWVEDPPGEIGAVVTANRGDRIVKANRIQPTRIGRGLLRLIRRVIIIDVGSVPAKDENGHAITVGNLDLSSIPKGNKVLAVGARHGVGPVTSEMAVKRAIVAKVRKFSLQQAQAAAMAKTIPLDIEELVAAA